jgi:ABC-2 type transport system ATP-binding protein
MQALEIINLTKRFGDFTALNSLNLKIEQGEIFGYLGPNGAGKTTTIRCMLDFIRPTSGEIKIFGQTVASDIVGLKQKIGYLPAENAVYRNWTGQQHFDYLQGIRKTRSKSLSKLIAALEFNPSIRVGTLSSGNLQKLSIIMALMFDPQLLVMDEPTKALDPILQHQFYDLIQTASKNGATVFVSSHNLSEVENICNRAGIIKKGELVTIEKISELKRKRMHIIDVQFNEKIDISTFKIPVVDEITETPDGFKIKVKEDLNPVMQIIAKHKVKDLAITKASLEEIFLEFYQ